MAIVNDNTGQAFGAIEQQFGAYVLAVLERGNEHVRAFTPVDTGLLKSNDLYEMTGPEEGRWYNGTAYSVAVELGHTTESGTYVEGQHYMQHGVDQVTGEGEAIARDVFHG